jgi:hypothetical protein
MTATLAALFVGLGIGLLGSTPDRVSQTSAVSAAPQPTPTYVSELGPATTRAPGQPAELPSTGTHLDAAGRWPQAAGLGLALMGCLLLHAAVTLRPSATR